jgi:hypothetical protein
LPAGHAVGLRIDPKAIDTGYRINKNYELQNSGSFS